MPLSTKPDPLPLSLLNDFLYCRRRAALKILEGWREANEHTERGDVVHEHSDLAGYEVVKGVKLLRALPVFSRRLGLNGKCDIVEQRSDGTLYPVEFKIGRRRQWDNDDAQLCAQALCLEEMFARPVPRGAIFHADSKRRREVEISLELRQSIEKAIAELHSLAATDPSADATLPLPAFKPACEECSLFQTCLPALAGSPEVIARATRALFQT